MAAFPISVQNPSPVFGLPANLCKLCPQYDHAIIFPRRCYNEMQCPIPSIFYRMKTRAGKAGNKAVAIDASKQVGYVCSVPTLRFGQPTSSIQRAPAPDSHFESIHHGEKAENKDRAQQMGSTFGCDTPTTPRRSLLGVPFLHRLSSTNFFKRFLAWAWKIRLERLKTREMTCVGWRKKQ